MPSTIKLHRVFKTSRLAASTSRWCRTSACAIPTIRRSQPAGHDDGHGGDQEGDVVGAEVNITQEGVPDVIPAEACYLGWGESLELLKLLVEPEIPDQG